MNDWIDTTIALTISPNNKCYIMMNRRKGTTTAIEDNEWQSSLHIIIQWRALSCNFLSLYLQFSHMKWCRGLPDSSQGLHSPGKLQASQTMTQRTEKRTQASNQNWFFSYGSSSLLSHQGLKDQCSLAELEQLSGSDVRRDLSGFDSKKL